MRCSLLLAVVAGAASGAWGDIVVSDAHLIANFPLGQSVQLGGFADAGANALYSNIDNFTAGAVYPGGAALSPLTTNVIMDDVNMTAATNGPAAKVTFSVANANTVATSARIRIRFWDNSGTGGGPGVLVAAFSFNPIAFAPGGSLFFFNPNVALPQNMWIGSFFDNSGTTATAADLNNLGVLTFNPPVIGTSGDQDFLTAAPSTAPGSNPAGTIRPSPLGPALVANYGYEVIPSPSSFALLGLGGLVALRRRRA
jgi:uncharacterized protein (TIGR03382 family)